MLNDVEWAEDGTYTPQGEHTPHEFFTLGLLNSVSFDLQLGYFNSAAINVLSTSFASFIKKGGKMRMAINQIVSEKDKNAITEGEKGGIDAPFDITDWQSIKDGLDEYGEHFFKCLAFLIQEKRIEIQIIKPKSSIGIAHTKRGLFTDENGMVVGFNGSANFTLGGLFNNLEEISIYMNTSSDNLVLKRLESQKKAFDSIMNQSDNSIEYLSPSDLEAAILNSFGDQNIDELIFVEKKLKQYKVEVEKFNNMVSEDDACYYVSLPKFPYPSGPRDYQQQAFENWKNNKQKGLFAMATGTGKTITALNCLLEIYNKYKFYKALILVPTISLAYQWEKECRKFRFNNVIHVNSKNSKWKEEVSNILLYENIEKNENLSYIIISTYASFGSKNIFGQLSKFPPSQLLLIADEAHNMSSGRIREILPEIKYARRIGLSATPNRQYDDEGNNALKNFFKFQGDSYTYEYSMKEAIANGVLCKYLYYPHLVQLNESEMKEYLDLSAKISKFGIDDLRNAPSALTMLLLKRKRIIHKAENKKVIFKEILEKRLLEKGNLKYSLIYVPEGNEIDTENVDLEMSMNNGDDYSQHLVDQYTEIVRNLDSKLTVREFTSSSYEREQILKDYAEGNIHVLTSMKCLDEGIDVPRSEFAIFCASTGNPRQFIQRRGRVLRIHKDKHLAEIHDLIVAPFVAIDSDSYNSERNLLRSELERVKEFASLAINKIDSFKELYDVMIYYKLNLNNE